MDCIDFFSSRSPAGELELSPALGEHLRRLRRPGKAILLSDFLMPASSYQQGLNLLRAFNLDISVIQVLSRQELEPPLPQGGVALLDSESHAQVVLQWSGDLLKEYQERLERHNRGLKGFCHQSGIHYSLFATDQEVSEFVLETLPVIGLLK